MKASGPLQAFIIRDLVRVLRLVHGGAVASVFGSELHDGPM